VFEQIFILFFCHAITYDHRIVDDQQGSVVIVQLKCLVAIHRRVQETFPYDAEIVRTNSFGWRR
jgi:hypothetical protein